ncbi:MAG: hypothetical protein KF886_25025 [Candidatus Hydrogenedentes bacterium]|nr:hypothetical protein [Candidatus Hydrogenedentota bacterium]
MNHTFTIRSRVWAPEGAWNGGIRFCWRRCSWKTHLIPVALLALLLALTAATENLDLPFPANVLAMTFPEPPALSREFPESGHPDFPESDANEVTRFWKLLRDDFSAMYRAGDPGASVERLEGYLQVRDAWLESGSLTKCILAATITMAIDEYLTILIQPGRGLSEPDFDALNSIATRNDLPPATLLAAFDAAWPPDDEDRLSFADVCAQTGDRDFYICWEKYLEGLGYQYQLLDWSEGVSARFIIRKPDLTDRERAGKAIIEQFVAGGMNGWRPVYALHSNDDFWMLLFLAYVLDEQQVRQSFWSVAVPVVEKGRILRIGNEKSAVAAFNETGRRWLSIQSLHDETKDDGQYFNRQTNYESRRGGFFDASDSATLNQ